MSTPTLRISYHRRRLPLAWPKPAAGERERQGLCTGREVHFYSLPRAQRGSATCARAGTEVLGFTQDGIYSLLQNSVMLLD